MKYDKNPRYFQIAVYAFSVLAAGILFFFFVQNAAYFKKMLDNFISLMMPFIGAFAIAFLLNPIMKWLENSPLKFTDRFKKHSFVVKRTLSLLITYALTFFLIYIFFLFVFPEVFKNAYGIVSNIPFYLQSVSDWFDTILVDYLMSFGITYAQISSLIRPIEEWVDNLSGVIPRLLPMILDTAMYISISVKNVLLSFVISIYMLIGKETFLAQSRKIVCALFPEKPAQSILSLSSYINKTLGGFVSGKVLDSLIIGILCFIGMSVFKMPYAMLISVIVGVTNVIPYFGPFIGAIPSIILLLFVNPISALWFSIFILALQQFDGNFLGPRILGESIGLSSFWIIFAVIVCGGVFGLLGMFLGVPIFAVIYYLSRAFIHKRLKSKGLPVQTSAYAEENVIRKEETNIEQN